MSEPESVKAPEQPQPKEEKEKEKEPETEVAEAKVEPPTAWQAIWSPQYNAYYFFNTETQETTWSNPLQPATPDPSTFNTPPADDPAAAAATPGPSTSTSAAATQYAALQAAALAQGIDPSLAYLDPSLAAPSSALPTGPGGLPTFTAKFNARTGQFTRPDARDPSHLSEYDRAKRMSEFYFDVSAWESDVAARNAAAAAEAEAEEGGGRKRKRPTKKDLERFKEQKKQKKIAKTAWLRT